MEEHTQRKEVMETMQEELKKFTRATGCGAVLPTAEGDQLTHCATFEPHPREAIQEQTPVQNQKEKDCLNQGKKEQKEKETYLLSANWERAQIHYQGEGSSP